MAGESSKALRRVRIASIEPLAVDILRFDLVSADGRPLAAFTAGAHIDVTVPSGLVRQYSLCGDPRVADRYTIAVKKEAEGRGGSISMHRDVAVDDMLAIAGPRNNFPLAEGNNPHIFIAGGIGITPIQAMINVLHSVNQDWQLAYCARSEAHAAFYQELKGLAPERVHGSFGETLLLDIPALTRNQPVGAHLYCCGPSGLMEIVKEATAHWAPGHVHFEWFTAPAVDWGPNHPFTIELKRSGGFLTIPPDQTILQVLRASGFDVCSSCEEGICGTCETRVLAGDPDHRDVLLSPDERAANTTMMICVSRARSERLVLDL